jgi:hypothetical protein
VLPAPGALDVMGVREVARHGPTVDLEIGDDVDALIKALANYNVLDLRTYQPTLEDLLLGYYRQEAT